MSKNKTIAKLQKPLPPSFRHVMRFDWFREFTWAERLKILFGGNLFVLIRIPTLHNPGQSAPIIAGEVTKHQTASSQVEEGLKAQVNEIVPPELKWS